MEARVQFPSGAFIKNKYKILIDYMFRRKRSKYDNFSPGDMPPRPPKPDEAEYGEIKEIDKIKQEDFDDDDDEHVSDASMSPPLFIKIDKYKNIVSQIRKLRSLSLGVRDAMDALTEIEKEIATGVAVANKSLDEFNAIVRELDLRFAKVREADENRISKPVKDYVEKGYKRVEMMKKKFEDDEDR